jgi:hypothetical protein
MIAPRSGILAAVDSPGLRLVRSAEREAEVAEVAAAHGTRVGLAGVAGALDRVARVGRVPAPAAQWGFRWEDRDQVSRRWWPQGITTSADAAPDERVLDRSWVVTSAYAKPLAGRAAGTRLSFVDIGDPAAVRYRHVLLVDATFDGAGALGVRPVQVHAGGIVWHRGLIHVAATARGLRTFRIEDVVECPGGDPFGWGYRFVLPLWCRYDAQTDPGREPMRYSFLSLDRDRRPPELVIGEYGHGDQSTRLLRHLTEPAVPVAEPTSGPERMQGVAVVDGVYHVATSAGRYRRGSLWVGRPGDLRPHRGVLAIGPEDLAYQRSTDRLWSLSEYPGRRFVYAMPRGRFS